MAAFTSVLTIACCFESLTGFPFSLTTVAEPLPVTVVETALSSLERFAREIQERQQEAGEFMNSAFGKARGLALRLSLVLEYLWWAAEDGWAEPPRETSGEACATAIEFVRGYLMPMAERVFGDAGMPQKLRNMATLARWIRRTRPREIHIRRQQRESRLPGLSQADVIREACNGLVEAGWLELPAEATKPGRRRVAYRVRADLLEQLRSRPMAELAGPKPLLDSHK